MCIRRRVIDLSNQLHTPYYYYPAPNTTTPFETFECCQTTNNNKYEINKKGGEGYEKVSKNTLIGKTVVI